MRGAVFFPYLGIWTGACAALLLPCALLAAALPFCSRPGTRRLAVWTAFGSCGLLGLVLARHIAGGMLQVLALLCHMRDSRLCHAIG